MKAIGYKNPGSIDRDDALIDIEVERPTPSGRDILVGVESISVNPVDTKVRRNARPEPGQWKILGWDVAGRVVAKGHDVTRFEIGDAVYYAGAITRPGANSQYHLVDERIVGHKPASLTTAEAAALPLTAITAYEMLFDRLDIRRPVPGAANAIVWSGTHGRLSSGE
jgi:zinc-binding alcohol dehydrogenase family protein